MKVVINKCFGGFGLSALAVKKYAERKGRECYFFRTKRDDKGHLVMGEYVPITMAECGEEFCWLAYDIPNPNDVLVPTDKWREMSMEERKAASALADSHSIETGRGIERHDHDLVAVVEELGGGHGTGASDKFANLKIIEIPDGVEYEINEHDGMETIDEVHRSWG